jgi:CRISPR-associated protein Csm3
MQETGTRTYHVTITTQGGLHIGGSNDAVEIGGIDNPVIKTKDGKPYIPGSSLKGKLRSLVELKNGKVGPDGKVHGYCRNHACEICRFFGIPGGGRDREDALKIGPTRFLFRELYLTETSRQEFDKIQSEGKSPLEAKTEVTINRSSGTGGDPRVYERVREGFKFEGKLVVRLFNLPGEKSDESILKEKFGDDLSVLKKLLENDYLGGSGSRGSGQIEISFKLEPAT